LNVANRTRCSAYQLTARVSVEALRTVRVLASVCSTTWSDRENVDHALGIPTIEDHSPLPNTQPPQALSTTQQLDVTVGQRADRGADPFTVPPTEPAQGLQCCWANLDPPSARVSQRSAPLRPQTKGRRARSAPAEWPADPPR